MAGGPDIDTVLGWRGRTVRDPDGEKIGRFGDVYLDRDTDLPAWAGVHTGLFGRGESLVPLDGIREDGDGGDLVVPHARELVKDAPSADPEVALEPDEEARLFAHYGLQDRGAEPPPGEPAPAGEAAEVIRSEEEVVTEPGPMRPSERVRLRKVLVTDEVQRTVPVRREVVQLEHEPPPEGRIEFVEDVDDPGR